MQGFEDQEKKVTCPYDRNHEIFISKLAKHLTKCRKNNPNCPVVICDYNSDHRIPKPELQYHLENCIDRLKDSARNLDLSDAPGMVFPIKNLAQPVVEQWDDDDYTHQGYNSDKVTENRNVLRSISVLQPAVRKQFRRDEQRRLIELRAPNPSVPANDIPPVDKEDRKEKVVTEDKPDLSLEVRMRDLTVYKTAEDAETAAVAEPAVDTQMTGSARTAEAAPTAEAAQKDEDNFQLPKKNGRKKKNNNKK